MEPGQVNPLETHSTKPGSVPAVSPDFDFKPADNAPLPRIFHSIMDLPLPTIGKLRALDMSRAMVVIKPRGGANTQPMPLAGFIADFPAEVAEELGTGGPMLAIIHPNDGQGEQFWFGFIAPGEVRATARESAEVAALRTQLQANERRFEELQKLILLSGSGGGASRRELLEEMKIYKDLFAPAAGAGNGFAEAMKMSGEMFVSMANGFKQIQGAATQLAVKQEPSIGAQIKEVMDIKGAPELAARLVDRVLPPRAGESPALAGPGTQRGNPLEKVA